MYTQFLTILPEFLQSKKGSKDQESIQSSVTPDQGTNGKVTNSELDITSESQEVSPFPAGGHKAQITDAHKGIANTRQKKT